MMRRHPATVLGAVALLASVFAADLALVGASITYLAVAVVSEA